MKSTETKLNKKCLTCTHEECKQLKSTKIIKCPHYKPKLVKEKD